MFLFECVYVYVCIVSVSVWCMHMCVQKCSATHARIPEEDMFLLYCLLSYSSDTGCLTNPESSPRAPTTSSSLTAMLELQLCLWKINSEAVWIMNASERRNQETEEQI